MILHACSDAKHFNQIQSLLSPANSQPTCGATNMIVTFFIAVQLSIGYYLYTTVVDGIGRHSWLLAGGISLCVACLVAALLMERTRWFAHSLMASKIGYGWMGVSFIFLSVALVLDTSQWLVPALDDTVALYFLLGLGFPLSIYGYVSARRINIRNVQLSSPKIATPIRIAQISDLHLGDSSSLENVGRIVTAINDLDADLIVSTGDLFDGYLPLMQPYVEQLRKIQNTALGKFAVCGNHEYYADLDACIKLTREAELQVLRNESVSLNDEVTLIGMDDPTARGSKPREEVDRITFENVDSSRFRIFLYHRPSIRPDRFEKFDLQLSGHTHGGQIFPFHFLNKLFYRAKPGLTQLDRDTYLYLSRGTGSWGPQFRVFAPPEITHITITPE